MAGIDDVLERLLTDAQFAAHLAQDPANALAGYELTADDLSLLSSQVSFDPGALSLVEERISKSSMFGMLTSLSAGLGSIIGPDYTPTGGAAIGPEYTPTGGAAGVGDVGGGQGPTPHMLPEPHMGPTPHMSPEIIPPIDMEEVVAPIDSEGVVGPSDVQGLVDPGDVGDPTGAGETSPPEPDLQGLDDWEVPAVQNPGGGPIGDGGEVYFKEVEPGVPTPDGGVHGTGGGAGSEVSIKEVDPAPQPTAEGGIVVQGGLTGPEGIVVQGGLTGPEGIVVQGG